MNECVCVGWSECIRFIIETFAATLGNLFKLCSVKKRESYANLWNAPTVFLSAGFAYEMSNVQICYGGSGARLILLITSRFWRFWRRLEMSATFFLFLLISFRPIPVLVLLDFNLLCFSFVARSLSAWKCLIYVATSGLNLCMRLKWNEPPSPIPLFRSLSHCYQQLQLDSYIIFLLVSGVLMH